MRYKGIGYQSVFNVLILVLLLSVAGWQWMHPSGKKIGFVKLNRLYDGFTYKQELEKELERVQRLRTAQLDSLKLGLERDSEGFRTKREDFYRIQERYSEEQQVLVREYDQKIWKQLNQYISDYGKAEGFDLLLGADGNGTLMYAEEGMDVTEALSTYVNKRYQGGDGK